MSSLPSPPAPVSKSSIKKLNKSHGRRETHVVRDEVTYHLSSVQSLRSTLDPATTVGLSTPLDAEVSRVLGYLPGNALSVLKFDDNGDPSVLELYPLTVRGTLVKSKKGGNSNSGDSKAQNPKVRKRRRVGSQRGGGNWNVSSNDSEGWSTTEEETGMVVVPMPTIHWLVSPHWNRVVSTLEDKYNGVQFLTDVFQRDGFMVRLAESHKQALKRTEELLKMGGDYEEAVTKRNWFPSTRGVGGMNVKNVGLRCLHMHLGEWFATGTHEVGRMVEEWGTWEVEGRGDEWMEKWKEVGGGGGET